MILSSFDCVCSVCVCMLRIEPKASHILSKQSLITECLHNLPLLKKTFFSLIWQVSEFFVCLFGQSHVAQAGLKLAI